MPTTSDSLGAVTGLVLAGGQSTRFGDADENKAVASVGERTSLGRVVDAVTAATGRSPVVAVRSDDQRRVYADALSDREVSFAFDDDGFEGPLAGIAGGADALDARWAFCCGCDMPLLSPAAVGWLVDELGERVRESDRPPAALALEHPDGTIEPLHTLYRLSAIERVREELPRTGGPRALLASLPAVETVPVSAVPDRIPVEESTTNVNTRTDLETATRRLPLTQ